MAAISHSPLSCCKPLAFFPKFRITLRAILFRWANWDYTGKLRRSSGCIINRVGCQARPITDRARWRQKECTFLGQISMRGLQRLPSRDTFGSY